MKKLFITLAIFIPLVAVSQIEKGKSFVSGGFSISINRPKDPQAGELEKSAQSNISAKYGYLVADRWAVGIGPSFRSQIYKYALTTESHFNSFAVTPFVRRYFPVGEKLFLHLEGGIGFDFQRAFQIGAGGVTSPVVKTNNPSVYISPGASYFVTPKVALQAALGTISYSWTMDVNGDTTSTGFGASFGLSSFFLGAAIYL